MATLTGSNVEEVRRVALSPRPKGRENAKDTLCRNVTIYGHCRYEDKGCAFNHDPGKVTAPQNPPESAKKRLNVDSPSFTPSSLAVNGQASKPSGLSPKAANAAPFKPKGISSAVTAPAFTPSLKQYNPNAPDWVASAPDIPEFLPQSYNTLPTNYTGITIGIDPAVEETYALEMAGTPARRPPARKVRNKPPVLPATPPGRQGPYQTGGVLQYGIQSSNQTGQIPQYGVQGSYSTGAISQYGNPHGHGTASQSTPPRFFGNIPLYISSEPPPHGHVHGAPTYQEPQERKPPNVLRANAQSFYPRIAQNVLPLDSSRLMPNPLQAGSSGSAVANNPAPLDFSQVQIFSAASSPFVPNSPAIPYTPFTPFYPAQSSIFPGNQQLSPLNQQFPNVENNPEISHPISFDQYNTNTPSIASASHTPQPQVNPYAQDSGSLGVPAYFQGQSNYTQPLLHHLYAAWGQYREPLQPNQRTAKDLFIAEDLRQSLQKRTEATLATFPNSTLPSNIAHFHSLVPLVHNTQKTATLFGYSSWVYKAMSSNDGKVYCLRRLQGYRLTNDATNETAIRSIQQNWKRVRNGNVVNVYLAFTNSGFGDSSLIFVTDYHPSSETLAQKHFTTARFSGRNNNTHVSEQILWGYVVQIASALKAIHSVGLAARVIDPSKVLLTSENRVRLNACAIMDVIQHDTSMSIVELQRQDLYQFGRLIHAIGTNDHSNTANRSKVTDAFSRSYSPHLRDSVNWLLTQNSSDKTDNIDIFLTSIAADMVNVFDASLHLDDQLVSDLNRELENSRIVRLLTKLNFINERPEYEHDGNWAEHGVRYILVLFRDYVFHQVDAQGNPVLDLSHVLASCNKLDAGIDEKMTLTSRDENTVVVVSFREVKTAVEAAWMDLTRRAAPL